MRQIFKEVRSKNVGCAKRRQQGVTSRYLFSYWKDLNMSLFQRETAMLADIFTFWLFTNTLNETRIFKVIRDGQIGQNCSAKLVIVISPFKPESGVSSLKPKTDLILPKKVFSC